MLVDHGIEARPPDENQKNAVKAADLPSILLERIEAAFPEPAIFGLLETESWPDGALRSLIDCRLADQFDNDRLRVELLQACYRSHRLNKPIGPSICRVRRRTRSWANFHPA